MVTIPQHAKQIDGLQERVQMLIWPQQRTKQDVDIPVTIQCALAFSGVLRCQYGETMAVEV